MPRTTITIRISSKVNPDSPIPSGAFLVESVVLVNHDFFFEGTLLLESKCMPVQSGEWFKLALFLDAMGLEPECVARTGADARGSVCREVLAQ